MDFCLSRIYSKFYITQILHAMKYIEFNHINYCLQEDYADLENEINNIPGTPKQEIKENTTFTNNPCDNFNQENPASFILTEKQVNETNNNNNNNNITFNNGDETNKNKNEMDFDEEEKKVLEELNKENNEQNLLLRTGKTIINHEFSDCNNDNVNKDENNLFNTNNNYDENVCVNPNKNKKYELIELTKENEDKYKKSLVYKNNVFSKLEIQGMVVEKRIMGHIEKNNCRMKLIIDDTTGIIEALVWRSNKENIFNKLKEEIRCGMIIRVLGLIENFRDTFQINLEYFEIIKCWKHELLFHKSLQLNQKTLKDSQLISILESLNESNNNQISTNKNLSANKKSSVKPNSRLEKTNNKNNKSLYVKKKDFANRILAFFKKYKLNDEINPEKNYIILKIGSLISNPHFSTMMNDFCRDNDILDSNKFLIESLTIIEENSMGKLIEEEQSVEIKLDDEVSNEILRMLRSNPEGLNYIDIFDRISLSFNNFFMNDFIKYIIEELIQNGKIQSIYQNFYQIMN